MAEFDTKVHHFDKKGHVVRKTPYTLVIENGNRVYVRDGVKYFSDGSLAEKPKAASKPKMEKHEKSLEAEILGIQEEEEMVAKDKK